jgi:SagB-type dehydrogenase family enzyme
MLQTDLRTNPLVRMAPCVGSRLPWRVTELAARRTFAASADIVAALALAARPGSRADLREAIEDALGKRAPETEALVERLVHSGLVVDDEQLSDDAHVQWCMEIQRAWQPRGWDLAADYHCLTYDYPCADYATDGFTLDRSRMAAYNAEQLDTDRNKTYDPRPGQLPLRMPAEVALAAPLRMRRGNGDARRLDWELFESILVLALGPIGYVHPARSPKRFFRRSSPSGGGRQPTEGYVVALDVAGLAPGVYHFGVEPAVLTPVAPLPSAAELQDVFCASAEAGALPCQALLVLTSRFGRNAYRYREPRTFRTVHMDVGHICATASLLARSTGLRLDVEYGDDPDRVERLLGVNAFEEGYQATVAIAPSGVRASTGGTPSTQSERAPVYLLRPALEPDDDVPVERMHLETDVVDTLGAEDAAAWVLRQTNSPTAGGGGAAISRWWSVRWGFSAEYYLRSRGVRRFVVRTPDAGIGARDFDGVPLPAPDPLPAAPLPDLLRRRRSARRYELGRCDVGRISTLLWHGLERLRAATTGTSTAETVALAHGWKLGLVCLDVRDLFDGKYMYDVATHRIRLLDEAEAGLRTHLVSTFQGMPSPRTVSLLLTMVLDVDDLRGEDYGEMTLRVAYLEAGRLAQEILVVGEALGLGTLVTPAHKDTEILELWSLHEARYLPIYSLLVGPRARAQAEAFESVTVPAVEPVPAEREADGTRR